MTEKAFPNPERKCDNQFTSNCIKQGLTKGTPMRRATLYPIGDRVAFTLGIILTLLAVSFFTWKMIDKLTQDWALQPVPASTPTPPLKSLNND